MLIDLFPKPVSGGPDLERILSLPERSYSEAALQSVAREVTLALRRPGSTAELRPRQALALLEGARCGGLLAPMGVGSGKTLLDILMPMVIPCRVCVLLVPAPLKPQLEDNWAHWSKHFYTPNLPPNFTKGVPTTYIVSYHELQNYKATELLEQYQPDLILADEAHHLRYKDSARTKRVLRYVAAHPSTRVCAWSGTLTNRSLKDYAHLAAICLKSGSPLPVHWGTVEDWARCLDANPKKLPAPPGALTRLCRGAEQVRDAFRRRFLSTPGVVATHEDSLATPLYILERKVEVPQEVEKRLAELRRTWTRPDGEELYEATQVAACARQLASGFFYRWKYPRGEPQSLIDEWLDVRANWHRELRQELKKSRPHMDSPKLLMMAAMRHEESKGLGSVVNHSKQLPVWESIYWKSWKNIRKLVQPELEPVWVSQFLVEDVLKSPSGSLVWYEHDAFGTALRRHVPVFGAGDDNIRQEKGGRTVAACIRSHGTGKELQMFNTNIVANYPSAHAAWEQFIGRTHRPGQESESVTVSVYRHTPELRQAFVTAIEYAKYTQETMGTSQKLLSASYGFEV